MFFGSHFRIKLQLSARTYHRKHVIFSVFFLKFTLTAVLVKLIHVHVHNARLYLSLCYFESNFETNIFVCVYYDRVSCVMIRQPESVHANVQHLARKESNAMIFFCIIWLHVFVGFFPLKSYRISFFETWARKMKRTSLIKAVHLLYSRVNA